METINQNTSQDVIDEDRTQNIAVYVGLVVACLVLSLTRALLFFYILINSSQHLHNRMFAAILRAPIYFFDSNPVGKCRFLFAYVLVFIRRNNNRLIPLTVSSSDQRMMTRAAESW